MLERIDDAWNRIFSFFLHPIINLIMLSWVFVSWFTHVKDIKYGIGIEIIESTGMYRSAASLIDQLAKSNASLIGNVSTNIGALLSVIGHAAGSVILLSIIVLAILAILIDRALLFLGLLMPLHIEFDYASFGRSQDNNDCLEKIYYALKADARLPIKDAYGMARSYLGEHSNDKFRDAHREAMIQWSLARLKMFAYAKAYVVLSLVMILITARAGKQAFNIDTAFIVMIGGMLFGLAFAIAYAHKSQELVEYDLDSFLWLRTHQPREDHELIHKLAERSSGRFKLTGELPSGPISKWIGQKLFLKFETSGYLRFLSKRLRKIHLKHKSRRKQA